MEFSPNHRKKTCGWGRCCVPNCTSKKNKDLHLIFHKVPPKNVTNRNNYFGEREIICRRQEWLRLL